MAATAEVRSGFNPLQTPVRPAAMRCLGGLLVVLGLLVPISMQWSISSLSDQVGLAIEVPDSLQIIDHTTVNFPVGSGPLATAQVTSPSGETLQPLRAHLRLNGFSLSGAEPETWAQPRDDAYDATVWTLYPSNQDPATVSVHASTLDDPRALFPLAALLAVVALAAGAHLASPTRLLGRRTLALAAVTAVVAATAATIAVRALHQAKQLIDTHTATYGPLPEDLYALGTTGPEAAGLAQQLCVVGGLYPFSVAYAILPLMLGAAGVVTLAPSRRGRLCIATATALAVIALLVVYASVGGAVVQILE